MRLLAVLIVPMTVIDVSDCCVRCNQIVEPAVEFGDYGAHVYERDALANDLLAVLLQCYG